mmetsp:Transcript_37599/g.49498  ORF Transcript_37599/g.49498 Transcript_37599/m.49498 type:complete len:90 (-) Transcript_37599:667-936(-)
MNSGKDRGDKLFAKMQVFPSQEIQKRTWWRYTFFYYVSTLGALAISTYKTLYYLMSGYNDFTQSSEMLSKLYGEIDDREELATRMDGTV